MKFVRLFLGVVLCANGIVSAVASDETPAERSIEGEVDRLIDAKLAGQGVPAAPQIDDAALIRRLTLDLVGRVPTAAEARAFVASTDKGKRVALVDRLMSSNGFVEHQASELDTLLTGGEGSLAGYLRSAVSENRPWDRIFREILLADRLGDATGGADAFLKTRVKDLDRLTNDVSVRFFGVNISCAQCHDHPYTAWTQDHYYGMKSFFSRTFENGGFVAERSYGLVSYKTTAGESRTAQPRFLVGEPLVEPESKEPSAEEQQEEKKRLAELQKQKKPVPPPSYSRRARLVEESLKPSQAEYFARAVVNRMWHRFFGRGLVMPLDQMHSQNPASHPELLDWLAGDLMQRGYDVRRLVRGLVLSNTYSRSSRWGDGERPAPELFAVAIPRPLSRRQYALSLRLATLDPESFAATVERGEIEKRLEDVEKQAQPMIGWFAQPGDGFQVSVDEALLLSNGEKVQKDLLSDGDGRLIRRLLAEDPVRRVELATWTVLSRPPTEEESSVLVEYLVERDNERPLEACQQLVWILLTGTEFRFNY